MQKDWLNALVRPAVLQLSGYVSARHTATTGRIFLDANENAYGSCIGKIKHVDLSRYPDPLVTDLRRKVAKLNSLSPEQVLLGNGSDELIWLTLFSFIAPGEEVVIPEPTFGMYRVFSELAGAIVRSVPLAVDFTLDHRQLLAAVSARTKVIFLCNPNNPTGQTLPLATIEAALQTQKLVIVDEAYIEFCPQASALALLAEYPNLLILRTFSKAWGLAGLRVGYALSSPEVVAVLAKVRAPYSVDVLSARLAAKALTKPAQAKMQKNLNKIWSEKSRLERALTALACTVFPSQANFLLVRLPDRVTTFAATARLAQVYGIVIRDFGMKAGTIGCVRITVGTAGQNRQLIAALKTILTA